MDQGTRKVIKVIIKLNDISDGILEPEDTNNRWLLLIDAAK